MKQQLVVLITDETHEDSSESMAGVVYRIPFIFFAKPSTLSFPSVHCVVSHYLPPISARDIKVVAPDGLAEPDGSHKGGKIKPEGLADLGARHGEGCRRLVQQADVAVRVGRSLGRRRGAGVGDRAGRRRCQGEDAVGCLAARLEARDHGVEVCSSSAGAGVLEVCGAVVFLCY